MAKPDAKGGIQIVQVPDRVLIPDADEDHTGNVAMLLRNATVTAHRGTTVEVEYVEEGALGKDVVRRRGIAKIVVHGSGNITLHLKDQT